MKKLENKVAIITGGAMGNGYGIAQVFLKYGATIYLLDYDDQLGQAITNLRQISPSVNGYKVDIRDNNMVSSCIQDIINREKHLDIVVNNAGVCRLEAFDKMIDELRDFHFDVNIKGTWNVTAAALPYLKAQHGSIVNLSSVTGVMVADAGEVAYATTKAAILGFTKSLAAELAPIKFGSMPSYPVILKHQWWIKWPFKPIKKILMLLLLISKKQFQ